MWHGQHVIAAHVCQGGAHSGCCVQQAMAILAFKADTLCSPYKHLFQEEQWESLVQLFHQELYRLNNITPQSVLAIHLQASTQLIRDGC